MSLTYDTTLKMTCLCGNLEIYAWTASGWHFYQPTAQEMMSKFWLLQNPSYTQSMEASHVMDTIHAGF